MTSSTRPYAASSLRARRRLTAITLVSLALLGGAVPSAYADPDTNIQKPGHLTAR